MSDTDFFGVDEEFDAVPMEEDDDNQGYSPVSFDNKINITVGGGVYQDFIDKVDEVKSHRQKIRIENNIPLPKTEAEKLREEVDATLQVIDFLDKDVSRNGNAMLYALWVIHSNHYAQLSGSEADSVEQFVKDRREQYANYDFVLRRARAVQYIMEYLYQRSNDFENPIQSENGDNLTVDMVFEGSYIKKMTQLFTQFNALESDKDRDKFIQRMMDPSVSFQQMKAIYDEKERVANQIHTKGELKIKSTEDEEELYTLTIPDMTFEEYRKIVKRIEKIVDIENASS